MTTVATERKKFVTAVIVLVSNHSRAGAAWRVVSPDFSGLNFRVSSMQKQGVVWQKSALPSLCRIRK